MQSLIFLSAVAALATTLAAYASDQPQADTRKVVVAGVEVSVDRHGRIDPLAEEQRERLLVNLRAQYAARGVAMYDGQLRVAANGAESMELGLSHERITVARITADGELETRCVRGGEAAARALASADKQ